MSTAWWETTVRPLLSSARWEDFTVSKWDLSSLERLVRSMPRSFQVVGKLVKTGTFTAKVALGISGRIAAVEVLEKVCQFSNFGGAAVVILFEGAILAWNLSTAYEERRDRSLTRKEFLEKVASHVTNGVLRAGFTIAGGLAGGKVGAFVGAAIGGAAGSIVPGIGTAVGAAAGAAIGFLIGTIVGGVLGGNVG